MKSDIDIIIPVYNRAQAVVATLESVRRQVVAPDSLIIVDNNSTDGSYDAIASWLKKVENDWPAGKPRIVLTKEKKPGAAAARNAGLRLATARYVMFFDSDDTMAPNHVADFAAALAADPEAKIAGRSAEITLLDGSKRQGRFSTFMPEFFNVFTGQMATQRWVAERELINCVGGWDETVRGWDDIELGARLLVGKPHIINVGGKPSVNVIVGEDSITEARFSTNPAKWEHALDCMTATAVRNGRRDLKRWIEARSMILAAEYAREGASGEAARLRAKVLASTNSPRRMNIVYNYHRRFPRFAWALTLCLFGYSNLQKII